MGRILGKYELGPKIGSGGMADIYLATCRGDGEAPKECCVKLIPPHLGGDPEFKKMFENEALIAGMLRHANVVQVLDYGRDGDTFYIAMEYVFGRDLRAVMDRAASRGEPMGVALAVRICQQAASGLSAAHRLVDREKRPLHVIHRDVSPQNILLSFSGEVKLTDFGISKLKHAQSTTRVGIIKGRPGYLSPEQAGGDALDVRTDVFSLGIVMWELLTGERLFKTGQDGAIFDALLNADIPKPSSHRFVPPELDAIVMKALSRDREARHADAGELADALSDFLGRWTHDYKEESVETFMTQLYPEERLQQHVPAGPPQVGPSPTVPPAPAAGKSRKAVLVIATATALALCLALAAYLYLPGSVFKNVALPQSGPFVPSSPQGVSKDDGPPATAPSPVVTPTPVAVPAPVLPTESVDPEPRTPNPKPASKTGKLTLNANPWADVYLRGKKLGTTPLTNHPLPEGTHKLVLRNPEINVQKEITVRIAPGELTTVPVDLMGR